jgi:hypothetical protein
MLVLKLPLFIITTISFCFYVVSDSFPQRENDTGLPLFLKLNDNNKQ